jgi:hypothetical protein
MTYMGQNYCHIRKPTRLHFLVGQSRRVRCRNFIPIWNENSGIADTSAQARASPSPSAPPTARIGVYRSPTASRAALEESPSPDTSPATLVDQHSACDPRSGFQRNIGVFADGSQERVCVGLKASRDIRCGSPSGLFELKSAVVPAARRATGAGLVVAGALGGCDLGHTQNLSKILGDYCWRRTPKSTTPVPVQVPPTSVPVSAFSFGSVATRHNLFRYLW